MDNASASLNEEDCQMCQWERDQTDEQFTLLANLDKTGILTHEGAFYSLSHHVSSLTVHLVPILLHAPPD